MQEYERKSERGQSLVEFALSLVMLLILLAVVVDGARALFTYLSMRDAAQESAAYGSYQPADTSGIAQRACEASNLMQDYCGDLSTCTGSTTANCGDMVISISYPPSGQDCMSTSIGGEANGITIRIDLPAFQLAMPFVGAFVGGQTVPISAEVTDTILTPPCP
jgi:hypothetical protein